MKCILFADDTVLVQRAVSCHLQSTSVIFNRAMRCLNTNNLLTNKLTTIHKMQKILQLKDIYNLEVGKFMYKYTTSQLPATFNNYFKLITDVHSYNTRQIKTRQFVLPKARSNSGAKMLKYSAIEIWSKSHAEIKIKRVWHFFWQSIRNMYYSATRTILVFLFIVVHKPSGLITYRCYSGKCQIMKYLCYVLHR